MSSYKDTERELKDVAAMTGEHSTPQYYFGRRSRELEPNPIEGEFAARKVLQTAYEVPEDSQKYSGSYDIEHH